jgi:hypothetical protein
VVGATFTVQLAASLGLLKLAVKTCARTTVGALAAKSAAASNTRYLIMSSK